MIRTIGLFAAAASFVAGKVYDTRFTGTTWDDEKWILATTSLDQGHYQSRMSLANGYLGINVAQSRLDIVLCILGNDRSDYFA